MMLRRTEGGLAWLGLMLLVSGSLLTGPRMGIIGAAVSQGLHAVAGDAAWLLPVWLIDVSRRSFVGCERSVMRAVRWLLFCTLSAVTLALLGAAGGWIGVSLASIFVQAIGAGATVLVIGTWAVLGLRLLGRERVEVIVVHAATVSRQALSQYRPMLRERGALTTGEVIDTVGEPVTPANPTPGPTPMPSTLVPVVPDAPVRVSAAKPPSAARLVQRVRSNWVLPDVDALLQQPKQNHVDKGFLLRVAKDLENRLRHFKLAATVLPSDRQGAIVARYEVTLSAGQEISKITARLEDLETAYKGLKFASLSGTGKLGIEIPLPEDRRRAIALREVLDSPAWTDHEGGLPLAIGVTSSGDPVVIDLSSPLTPHLLVAGATGSGKSVGINAMLTSLLVRNTPAELQLLIFDPKVVEFVTFFGLPHLLKPVITEMEEAVEMLAWACDEMDRRYRKMAAAKAKNLDGYNRSAEPSDRMARIVIVIDEYADLISVRARNPDDPEEKLSQAKSKDLVEGFVMRLAQKARAAGIHVILATQRPSVDVLGGAVKANFGSRVSYKVSQREDSKTTIGTSGAETLLGLGDALCKLPSISTELIRVHGAFVDESEVVEVVNGWTSQASSEERPVPLLLSAGSANVEAEVDELDAPPPPKLAPILAAKPAAKAPAPSDELFATAVEIGRRLKHVSVRQLEEELSCGHKKAKKLFGRMLAAGLVKPGGKNNTHVFCGANAEGTCEG